MKNLRSNYKHSYLIAVLKGLKNIGACLLVFDIFNSHVRFMLYIPLLNGILPVLRNTSWTHYNNIFNLSLGD